MTEIITTILMFGSKFGYLGIIILMMIESSFVPFPSEVVIPPAAFLAARGEMNLLLVIICGVIGSLLGATINYLLAVTLGRKLIYSLAGKKITSFLLLNEEKLDKAENYFLDYGNLSTFIGRLVPAVRQLISIPAGFARMKLGNFLIFTALGSLTWTTILAVLGYSLGANNAIFKLYYKEVSILMILLASVIFLFILFKKRKKKI